MFSVQPDTMNHQRTPILIAEDNLVLSDVLRFNLERAGYAVSVTNSGTQAVELLQRTRFEMILTDYQMPGINGEGICRHARSDGIHGSVPIVLISAKCFELDVAQLIAKYALSKVLSKPFSPREVVRSVGEALEAAHATPAAT